MAIIIITVGQPQDSESQRKYLNNVFMSLVISVFRLNVCQWRVVATLINALTTQLHTEVKSFNVSCNNSHVLLLQSMAFAST